jgi:hypothetical protein
VIENHLDHIMSYTAKLTEPEVIGPLPEGIHINIYVAGERSAARSYQENFARSGRIS